MSRIVTTHTFSGTSSVKGAFPPVPEGRGGSVEACWMLCIQERYSKKHFEAGIGREKGEGDKTVNWLVSDFSETPMSLGEFLVS